MKKEDILSSDYIDILFERRNKHYGAYLLRLEYKRSLIRALIYTCAGMIFLLLLPFLISLIQGGHHLSNEDFVITEYNPVIPKGILTPEYLPPPPVPEKTNVVPIVVKDSVPEDKKDETKKPPPIEDSRKTVSAKDTARKTPGTGNPDGDPNAIMIDVDNVPSWANHQYADFQDYITKNIKTPESEILMRHYGTVVVTATINADGSLTNVIVSHGITPALNAEALRVIAAMPRLNPAMRHRHPVRTYMKFPVSFLPSTDMKSGK